MKKIYLSALLVLLFSLLFADIAEALSEKQMEARAEVFKAIKEKKLQAREMGPYMSEIDKSDEKAGAVIEKLAKLKKMVSQRSNVGFRGDGNGIFPEVTPPQEWSMKAMGQKKNIIWQTMLPSTGPSSAIVVGPDVFTCGNNWDLICVDKKSGKLKWVKTFGPYEISTAEERAKNKKIDELAAERDKLLKAYPLMNKEDMLAKDSERTKIEKEIYTELQVIDGKKYFSGEQDLGFTNTTPASDGQNIYVWNALGITACFTPEGEMKWITQNLGPKMHHGYHSSPCIIDGKVITFMKTYIALDTKDGRKLWESGTGGLGNELIYSSPVPVKIGDTWCFIMGNGGIMRVSDGKVITKPARFQGGFASASYGSGYVCILAPQPWASPKSIVYFAKMPSSAAEAAATSWNIYPFCEAAKVSPPSDECMHSSPVIKDGLLYFAFSRGDFFCFDLEKGKYLYNVMLDEEDVVSEAAGRPYRSGILASITLANNLLYVMSDQGTMFIIEPGPKYKLVAKNNINQRVDRAYRKSQPEGTISTPFFEGNQIFYRAERYMYCIGLPDKPFME